MGRAGFLGLSLQVTERPVCRAGDGSRGVCSAHADRHHNTRAARAGNLGKAARARRRRRNLFQRRVVCARHVHPPPSQTREHAVPSAQPEAARWPGQGQGQLPPQLSSALAAPEWRGSLAGPEEQPPAPFGDALPGPGGGFATHSPQRASTTRHGGGGGARVDAGEQTPVEPPGSVCDGKPGKRPKETASRLSLSKAGTCAHAGASHSSTQPGASASGPWLLTHLRRSRLY